MSSTPQQQPIRGKFLKNNNNAVRGKVLTSPDDESRKQEVKPVKKVNSNVERRKQIFAELEKAEDLVLQVLEVAAQTADELGEMCISSNGKGGSDTILKGKGEEVLEKVSQIHSILAPHAHLVVPYQKKFKESKKEDVYKERVKCRLLLERKRVLEMLLESEETGCSSKSNNKRKLDDVSK